MVCESQQHMIPVDDDLGEMLTWAVRYSLGRRTYAVGDTCRFVTPLLPHLDERTLCCMERDIRAQSSMGYGDECDELQWIKLLTELQKELSNRGLNGWS